MSITYVPNDSTRVGSLSSGTIAASATVTFTLDLSTVDTGNVQIPLTFGGTVATTSGIQIGVEAASGSGPTYDTAPVNVALVPAVASATPKKSVRLSTGKYTVALTNLDATNAVTVGTPILDTWVK